ncbi:MAG: AmmeMemoRadiSam system protein B [Planctomycetota bacterium]
MLIRKPAVAGMFYPREAGRCAAELEDCVERARGSECPDVSGRIVGGVVPHAGWVCSGAVAARVIDRIAVQRAPAVVVVFGAIHVGLDGPQAYLYPSGVWETPLGPAHVDEGVSNQLVKQTDLLAADAGAHAREHSIEVEVPFIQHLLPDSLIVPIMVPVNERAAALGTAVGQVCKQSGVDAIFLASTDLTHYGPSYSFAPQGVGPEGLRWAKDVNDRRMIDLILAMREGEAVNEACANWNACGAGAVAATIAACKAIGAGRATLLEHTTSYEVLRERYHEPPHDAVGYAGLVFHE